MQYVRRRPGERLNLECVRPTVKYPAGQMVWGCFSYYGIGELVLIKGTVNAKVYLATLQKQLLPFLKVHNSQASSSIFQDDSAPCHRAKIVNNTFFYLFTY